MANRSFTIMCGDQIHPARYYCRHILERGYSRYVIIMCRPMGWNIDHTNFNNIVIDGNNLAIYAENNLHITLWIEEEIKKAIWHRDAVMVFLKNGETRKYINHMHYVTLQPTALQKTFRFFRTRSKSIISWLPRFSGQRSRSKYEISPSTQVS